MDAALIAPRSAYFLWLLTIILYFSRALSVLPVAFKQSPKNKIAELFSAYPKNSTDYTLNTDERKILLFDSPPISSEVWPCRTLLPQNWEKT